MKLTVGEWNKDSFVHEELTRSGIFFDEFPAMKTTETSVEKGRRLNVIRWRLNPPLPKKVMIIIQRTVLPNFEKQLIPKKKTVLID